MASKYSGFNIPPPSLPPPSPSPSPHVQENRRNSRDAAAVLIFWDRSEYVYFRTYLVFIFVLRKCLRIVLKYQRQILMEQRRPKKPTDEWICQRIFKWISSSPVSALLGIQNGPWPRVVKYFSFFVTHQLFIRTSLFTCWSLFFALTLRERSAQARDCRFFSPLEAAHNFICLLFVAPGGTANRQANCVAEKAGNLALYEVKLVHIYSSFKSVTSTCSGQSYRLAPLVYCSF